ncbi:MAG TPA: DUF883 C-terminal domain-containing protein [Gammaproteobacteria bacterium]
MEPTDKTTPGGNGHADSTRRTQARAHETVDRAARGVHDTVDRFADAANRTMEHMNERGEKFSETRDRMMAETRSYVQAHPIASIGIAVAAGFLLSRLMRSD